jgi:glycosyltransferase involved in cell wall biosynthesis
MEKSCTCIIPLFNEEERILWVLRTLITIKYFDQIILVNDGSSDKSKKVIEEFLKNNNSDRVQLVSYEENRWKAAAVHEWLKQARGSYVFLCDADLQHIDPEEIITMIKSVYAHEDINMGILRRSAVAWHIKFLYKELILSWQRVLRTDDLHEIFKDKIDRYQLEMAINLFMEKHKKLVVRYPFSADNVYKREKWWFWNGRKRDLLMYKDIFWYQGVLSFVRHSYHFQPKSITTYNKKNT